jgi:hypothetical protein
MTPVTRSVRGKLAASASEHEEAWTMVILRIEHPVPDYERWKKAFDSDPVDREGSGVRRHSVMRAVGDPEYVVVDIEFDDVSAAEAMLGALRELWSRADVMRDPQARIVELVETREYR